MADPIKAKLYISVKVLLKFFNKVSSNLLANFQLKVVFNIKQYHEITQRCHMAGDSPITCFKQARQTRKSVETNQKQNLFLIVCLSNCKLKHGMWRWRWHRVSCSKYFVPNKMFGTKWKQFEIFKVSSKQLQTSQIHFIILKVCQCIDETRLNMVGNGSDPPTDQTANF